MSFPDQLRELVIRMRPVLEQFVSQLRIDVRAVRPSDIVGELRRATHPSNVARSIAAMRPIAVAAAADITLLAARFWSVAAPRIRETIDAGAAIAALIAWARAARAEMLARESVVRAGLWVAGAAAAVRARVRLRDVVRVLAAGVAVAAVVLGIGFRMGQPGTGTPEAVLKPSPVIVASVPEPATANLPADPGSRVVPLAWMNPITGPDRPPLPADEHGPYGSRRTTGTHEVALTFDDGPDPRFTPELLDLLRQYRIKATFCVIGVNVVEFPELVRAIDADGHTLCNHSWGHDTGLGNRGGSTIVSDMVRTNQAIQAAAPNARISYFRHPGGMWTTAAVDTARRLGMTSLHWDVDPRDWLRPGARAISSVVNTSTTPGAIVLLHDGGGDRRGTMDALHSILPSLTTRFALVALPPGMDHPRRYGIDLPVHFGQQ